MINNRKFSTGSFYTGSFDEKIYRMDGFGLYEYPDGSLYRGYFMNGKFHGRGTITLAYPHSFTIKGIFRFGHLVESDDLIFDDGLHLDAKFSDNTLTIGDWSYCSESDRRYFNEMTNGLEAVSCETSNRPACLIPKKCYDTEEGFYKTTTGCLAKKLPPFGINNEYIACANEVEWIKKNCRKNDDVSNKYKLDKEVCKKILQNNVQEMSKLGNIVGICACNDSNDFLKNRRTCKQKFCPKKHYKNVSSYPEENDDKSIDIVTSTTPTSSSRTLGEPAQSVDYSKFEFKNLKRTTATSVDTNPAFNVKKIRDTIRMKRQVQLKSPDSDSTN